MIVLVKPKEHFVKLAEDLLNIFDNSYDPIKDDKHLMKILEKYNRVKRPLQEYFGKILDVDEVGSCGLQYGDCFILDRLSREKIRDILSQINIPDYEIILYKDTKYVYVK